MNARDPRHTSEQKTQTEEYEVEIIISHYYRNSILNIQPIYFIL
jgi:hypothetical protein